MFNTVVGILLILIVGMCVVAFPFVLWMLFGVDLGPGTRATPLGRVKEYRRNMTRLTSKATSKGR